MKYIAVNCYDNGGILIELPSLFSCIKFLSCFTVLRVFDRKTLLFGNEEVPRPLQSLRGHRNKKWPIKSSFFCGEECPCQQSIFHFPSHYGNYSCAARH